MIIFMNEPNFIIMRLADGYAAISNMHGRFVSPTLVGFGAYIRDEMLRRHGIASDEVEFTRGEELAAGVSTCRTCAGATRIESDGVAGQYLRDEFDTIDLSLKATRVCSTCFGLGCEIPGFWETATKTF